MLLTTGKVFSLGQSRDVRVPTKLCCAVEHARLAAHQQVLGAARSQSQKDFENRVRDQASLRSPKRNPKVFGFPASAVAASCNTTVPIRLRKEKRLGIPCSCRQFVVFSSQKQGRSRYRDGVFAGHERKIRDRIGCSDGRRTCAEMCRPSIRIALADQKTPQFYVLPRRLASKKELCS